MALHTCPFRTIPVIPLKVGEEGEREGIVETEGCNSRVVHWLMA